MCPAAKFNKLLKGLEMFVEMLESVKKRRLGAAVECQDEPQ